jgi:hypothetical protein
MDTSACLPPHAESARYAWCHSCQPSRTTEPTLTWSSGLCPMSPWSIKPSRSNQVDQTNPFHPMFESIDPTSISLDASSTPIPDLITLDAVRNCLTLPYPTECCGVVS